MSNNNDCVEEYNNLMGKLQKRNIRKGEDRGTKGIANNSSVTDESKHSADIAKFHGSQGQGFAAERANDLIDNLTGKDAKILGDNNAKDGADRIVDGKLIQTKYCQDAKASVNAAFKNGRYRYGDMQLEVPSDQYEDAVKEMAEKIKKGKVPGHTDPNDAKKIIRKGNVTYQQAVNIAKAFSIRDGNIESLIYDAANACVICVSVMGISSVITFAKSVWEGKSVDEALDNSVMAGMHLGGMTFCSSVLTAQLAKAGVNSALNSASENVVKLLPRGSSKYIIGYFEKGAEGVLGEGVKSNVLKAAKYISSSVVAQTIVLLTMSAGDIAKVVQGKISGKQLFKNMTALALTLKGGGLGSVAGMVIGGLLGTPFGLQVVGKKIGYYVGGFVGGSVAGSTVNKKLSEFIEDDSVEMVRILQDRFIIQCQDYLLNDLEVSIAVDDLRANLNQFELLEMFASKDRIAYADKLVYKVIKEVLSWRAPVVLPTSQDLNESIDRIVLGTSLIYKTLENGDKEVDYSALAKKVAGKEFNNEAAKKGFYIASQMDAVQKSAEANLKSLHYDCNRNGKSNQEQDEKDRDLRINKSRNNIDEYKRQIKELLGE